MRSLPLALVALMTLAGPAFGAEHVVKMLNKGADGMFVFEPALVKIAPGDKVTFQSIDAGHNVESIPGMLPDGAPAFTGKPNETLTVTFDKPGVYGYRCKPHYGMGMVGVVVVGTPTNLDAAKAVPQTGKAKAAFEKLLAGAK
ncbi:pseudoazurin [Nitrospirillum pindoramense]|uniref:Pseudoazurin n=1 Tax=Nitrospirillum amazonense TaxID=28077 RepID=A0A560GR95_9PROT|nr:pseudoazurin [Nitrospirillum amazonense]TWB36546.1 pseudoazurin [Nitrospirillum amazonense]